MSISKRQPFPSLLSIVLCVADVPCGVLICALRRARLCSGEICHTAGDMRAERAEMGYTGIWREESSAEYGGGICALSRAERERGYIETKKTTSYPSRRKPLFPIRWDDAPGILLLFLLLLIIKCSCLLAHLRVKKPAKLLLFFELTKYFLKKMQKKMQIFAKCKV